MWRRYLRIGATSPRRDPGNSGATSVRSGSLIIVLLLVLYPALRVNDLVGTDLVQAIPLVMAAALGHALFGDLRLDIAGAVLVGSVPGVLIGARISSRAPAGLVRAALVVVLLASALKLLGASTGLIAAAAAAATLVAVAIAVVNARRPATPPADLGDEAGDKADLGVEADLGDVAGDRAGIGG